MPEKKLTINKKTEEVKEVASEKSNDEKLIAKVKAKSPKAKKVFINANGTVVTQN